MRKRLRKNGKRSLGIALTLAVSVSGLPINSVYAGSPADRSDTSVLYFVDCGDIDTSTVPTGEQLGTHNSVTEQVYGEDAVTGYKWGIDDGTSSMPSGSAPAGISTDWTWPNEGVTTDQTSKTATFRYTKNQYEKGKDPRTLGYRFEIENGTYDVEVGLINPWGCSTNPTLTAEGKSLQDDISVSAAGTSVSGTVTVSDGELNLLASGTGDANKAINFTYILITSSGADSTLAKDVKAVSIPEETSVNITLPTNGSNGSSISWFSSNESVITSEGVITRGIIDQTVTLTATFKLVGASDVVKNYKITVKAANDLMGASYFTNDQVKVEDVYYDEALELDVENMLLLDPDRLLANFRMTAAYGAGLSKDEVTAWVAAESIDSTGTSTSCYGGGWENSLIGGHTLGHYLSALATAAVNPGLSTADRTAVRDRMEYIVSELGDCQKKGKTGYIFGATLPNTSFQNNVELQFDNVEAGKANISSQAWVPWYTMHKIIAGLVDCYEIAGNEEALEIAMNLGEWVYQRSSKWTTATQATVLSIEYGGMNDCMYQLYKMAKSVNYENADHFYEAAHKFDEEALFKKVASGDVTAVNGLHANTTIPKFLGALGRYEANNSETDYLTYAEEFWDLVINNWAYVTGGESENEHFNGGVDSQNSQRDNVNNETCCTYNMLKLSRRLFIITGDKKYADYYENTLVNAIMPSQNHETGMTMYFQPMATGYQKVYSTLDNSFWCCTGSGYENFTKLNDSIYFKKDNIVIVNQYLASTLSTDQYTIRQTGDLSKDETVSFTVDVNEQSSDLALYLRVPDWVTGSDKVLVKFGDESYNYETKGGYLVITNDMLSEGASFTVTLPMQAVAYNLPDSPDTYAFKYGPYVLSAKLGTDKQTTGSWGVALSVPTTKAVSSDKVGITQADVTVEEYMENISDNLVKGDDMTFSLKGVTSAYTFVPHYLQKESYGIYWTYYLDGEGVDSAAILEAKNEARLAEVTIDSMTQAGYGQYEARFVTDEENKGFAESGNGSTGDSHASTRYANAGGSFAYKMLVDQDKTNYLLVNFAKEDDGKKICITAAGTVLYEASLNSATADAVNLTLDNTSDYYQVKIAIPASVLKTASDYTYEDNGQKVTAKALDITFASDREMTADSARIYKNVDVITDFANENELTSLSYKNQVLSADNGTYSIAAGYSDSVEVSLTIKDNKGLVAVNGSIVDETKPVKLTADSNTLSVYAQNFTSVKTYTIQISRDYSAAPAAVKDSLVKGFTFDNSLDGADTVLNSAKPAVVKRDVTYTEGISGKAVQMNGTYGLRLLEDASVMGDSYTVSFWMNPKTVGNQYNPTLTGGTFNPQYWLNLTTDGKLWSDDGAWVAADATNAYTAGTWQQVTVVVDDSERASASNTGAEPRRVKTLCVAEEKEVTAETTNKYSIGSLYVNGKLVYRGNVAPGIMTKSGAGLYFGVNAWDALFNGMVDEVLVFNRALSATEVGAIAAKAITTSALGITANTSTNTTDNNTNSNNTTSSSQTDQSDISSVLAKGYGVVKNKITVKAKTKITLMAILSDGSYGKVSYKTSNKKVASVTAKGVVKTKKAGKAKITLTLANGKKKVVTVVVTKKAVTNKGITLAKKKISLKKGKTDVIKLKKLTKNATSKITYKSSNKKVAKVDAYGKITAKKKGKAVITVTCGKAKAKLTVTVK